MGCYLCICPCVRSFVEASCAYFRSLGTFWESWGSLGFILDALGVAWAPFWVSGRLLGSILGALGFPWAAFWGLWGSLGLHFGSSGGLMGAFGGPGGRPWPPKGPKANFFNFSRSMLG